MKEIFNRTTRKFSTVEKTFSDWDQIRDLVNDQLPKGIKKVEKVRGSETDKSYKVRVIYQSRGTKEIEVPITGKDALGNYNRATRSKVENTARHEVSEENKEKYRARKKGYTKEQLQIIKDSESEYDWDRSSAAGNPNCPPEILEKLSKDKIHFTRMEAISNPNFPKKLLEELSYDDDGGIRNAVAINPNCPPEVLEILSKDDNEYVIASVGRNPNTPEKVLYNLGYDPRDYAREAVAKNPNCPKEILNELVRDRNKSVREAASKRRK